MAQNRVGTISAVTLEEEYHWVTTVLSCIEQINLATFTDDTLVKTSNGESSVLAAANNVDEAGNHKLNSNNFVAEKLTECVLHWG